MSQQRIDETLAYLHRTFQVTGRRSNKLEQYWNLRSQTLADRGYILRRPQSSSNTRFLKSGTGNDEVRGLSFASTPRILTSTLLYREAICPLQ
jgi:hypothetical protein